MNNPVQLPYARVPESAGPLGVVGGMGSLATAVFLEVLARTSPAQKDQDHIPFVALSLPEIPDRSDAIMSDNHIPRERIAARIKWLENVGCGAIAIPCNTAHFWKKEFSHSTSVPFLNMVDITNSTIETVYLQAISKLNIIPLGTAATTQCGLYPKSMLERYGAVGSEHDTKIRESTEKVIRLIKSGHSTQAKTEFFNLISFARSFKPDAIILGCSELSVLADDFLDSPDIFDPIRLLATACVSWWYDNAADPKTPLSRALSNG